VKARSVLGSFVPRPKRAPNARPNGPLRAAECSGSRRRAKRCGLSPQRRPHGPPIFSLQHALDGIGPGVSSAATDAARHNEIVLRPAATAQGLAGPPDHDFIISLAPNGGPHTANATGQSWVFE